MMKKIFLVLSLLFSITLSGCYTNVIYTDDIWGGEDNDDDNGNQPEQSLTIYDRSQLNRQMSADADVCEVAFKATGPWLLEFSGDASNWIFADPSLTYEKGEVVLKLYTSENYTGSLRHGDIVLKCGNTRELISIQQTEQCFDGSIISPYEPPFYEEFIDRITTYRYNNGTQASDWKVWNFLGESQNVPTANVIEKVRYTTAQSEIPVREIEETIQFYPQNMEINILGVNKYNQQYGVLRNYLYENITNDFNFVNKSVVQAIDFENVQEKISPTEVVYQYSRYQLVSKIEKNRTTKYVWQDDRMMAIFEHWPDGTMSDARYLFSYTSYSNNRTNIDINAFLLSDVMGITGYMGKRSGNLLSEIIEGNRIRRFEYTFDEQGRVTEIDEFDPSSPLPDAPVYRYELTYK